MRRGSPPRRQRARFAPGSASCVGVAERGGVEAVDRRQGRARDACRDLRDLDELRHVVDEAEQDGERQQSEEDRQRDAQRGDERRLAGALPLDLAQHDQRVAEGAEEHAGHHLDDAVGEEGPQRARRELLGDQLERDDRDREAHAGDPRDRCRDHAQRRSRRGRVPGEDQVEAPQPVASLDGAEDSPQRHQGDADRARDQQQPVAQVAQPGAKPCDEGQAHVRGVPASPQIGRAPRAREAAARLSVSPDAGIAAAGACCGPRDERTPR